MLGPANEFVLQFLTEVQKIVAIAGDPDDQVPVLLGVDLGFPESLRRPAFKRSVSLSGKLYENTIVARTNTEFEYDVRGLFSMFTALVGIDDASPDSDIGFVIVGDGKELWRSGTLKKADSPKPLKVTIAGIERLVLRVAGGTGMGMGRGIPSAAWAEARLLR